MTLATRRPTGLPSWPMILLAGREGAGKSFAAATASASPLIERTFWIGIGEDDPDEYGAIPGADFEIVEHDGTVAGIIQALRDVATLPKAEKPYLEVVDSMTKLWDLIVDNAQRIANSRAKGRKTASGDYAISPDLWNVAKGQWDDAMDAIRLHRGPSILTARLDEVMVMNDDGQPTKEKKWKVQAHKSLVYDVGFVVEMHERGEFLITKAKSLRMQIERPTEAPGFTIATAWERLGITAEAATADRTYQGTVSTDPEVEVAAAVDAWTALAKEQTTRDGLTAVWQDAKAKGMPGEVMEAIRLVAAEFVEPLADAGTEPKKATRLWLRDARAMTTPAEVQALFSEAKAQGVDESILNELADIAASLATPAAATPDEPWAAVDEPPAEEVSEGPAAALEDAAVGK